MRQFTERRAPSLTRAAVGAIVLTILLARTANASLLSSSVWLSAGSVGVLTGASTCTSTGVPAECSYLGTFVGYNKTGSGSGSGKATPSTYDIDLQQFSALGVTDGPVGILKAEVETVFLVTGPLGSGFVQYRVSGDKVALSDWVFPFQTFVGLTHESQTTERVDLTSPLSGPVSFTSMLYPIQFGLPFSMDWTARLSSYGTGNEHVYGNYLTAHLQLNLFDANGDPVRDATISDVTDIPEPATWALVLMGLLLVAMPLSGLIRATRHAPGQRR